MTSRFRSLSTRAHCAIILLATVLPVGVLLFAFLVNDVRLARSAAQERVRLLAVIAAADLERQLAQSKTILASLAARPLIKALDPGRCDPIVSDFVPLRPEFLFLDVRDLKGTLLCSYLTAPAAMTPALESRWLRPALQRGDFAVSGVAVGRRTGKQLIALSYPIRDDDGRQAGLVILGIDLMKLNQQMLGATPGDAVVTVADSTRTVVLRSSQPEVYIGTRPASGEPDPAGGRREGFLETVGRDGVPRLFAFVTMPGIEWRVAASLPRAEVFAASNALIARGAVIGVSALLLGAMLMWRVSVGIVGPMATLRRTAERIAAGEVSIRAPVSGPAEIRAVAVQFNHMLDARAQAEARLSGIIETAVDAILTTDERHVIVQANAAAGATFGCSEAEMIGAPLERFIPRSHREQHGAEMRRFAAGSAMARHMGHSRSVTALRADGVEFPIEAAISHLTVDGKTIYTVILRDVTERNRAEVEVRAGKAKLESALSSMTDAVLISDADGRFVDINAAAAAYHHFADVDACKRALGDSPGIVEMALDDATPLASTQRPVSRALRGESASGVEYRLRRVDTGESWIGSYSYAPIRGPDGAIAGSVVVCRDVTAAREVQADLEASHAALRRLNRERDRVQEEERARIARELHDDLQQSLAAIRIDLAELKERLARGAEGEAELLAELDGLAAQAIASTRRIVNDLRPRLLEELGLGPALEAMARQFESRTGIACDVVAPEGLSDILMQNVALATCLFRVAQEALNNVGKHSGATSVRIALAMVADTQVSLSVIDDGRGIEAGDRRKQGSHGLLGMSERVGALGGTLRVESMAEGGTLLEVIAPLDRATPFGWTNAGTLWVDAEHRANTTAARRDARDDVPRPPLGDVVASPTVQALIDAMPDSAAVLDGAGVIRFVNRAWATFAAANGNPGSRSVGPGVDYLAVCRHSADADGSVAPVVQGLTAVVQGREESFTHDYPCHSPAGMAWYRMHAVAISFEGVLVTHSVLASADRAAD